MAEILGLGCTHYPGLLLPDERLPGGFHHLLTAPNVPAKQKDPANWPSELLAELGNDKGVSSARRYGERMADGFRAVRKALDDFDPDLVLIWGDDQYENFREDIIPAFCIMGLDDEFALKPWHTGNGAKTNRWNEAADWTMKLHDARNAAKHLASGLIERAYGLDASEIAAAIERTLQADVLVVEDEQQVFAVTALRDGRASFADALIGALGERAGCSHRHVPLRGQDGTGAGISMAERH